MVIEDMNKITVAENKQVSPVQLVKIKNKVPLFKKEEEATSIEIIQLEDLGFEVVSQKDLYEIGDIAVYIQPDYCLSDIPLFESFIRPQGDPKKTRLGSNNRIRAIKFNLHRGDDRPVYSVGILLPLKEVSDYCMSDSKNWPVHIPEDFTSILGITKWEEPEPQSGSGISNSGKKLNWPNAIIKTDETNINNCWKQFVFPIHLVGTEKIDGSSITLGLLNGEPIICSRNQRIPIFVDKVIGQRKATTWEKIKKFFGYKIDLDIVEQIFNESNDFVKHGWPYVYYVREKYLPNIFPTYQANGSETDREPTIIFQGELNGRGLKGSGNSKNPSQKEEPNIKFFNLNVKVPNQEQLQKVPYDQFDFEMNDLDFPRCKEVFNRIFTSKEDLINTCNDYFKDNMIEGIVVRNLESTLSAKVMSLDYDAKK